MEKKVKIKKPNKIEEIENFEDYSKEELIERIKALSAHNLQLKNVLAKQTTEFKKAVHNSKPFEFSKYHFQHVALHLLYLGWDYKGYVIQEDTTSTIEHHLFEALIRAKLIQDRSSSNYHRCGRTDKGVSSFGQVISIDLRTNTLKQSSEGNTKLKKAKEELNYCKILNKILPDNIQCVGWSAVDDNFSARFDCKLRTYKYYFPKGELDIGKMKIASEKLVGTHDFRNFCKMDVGNGVVEFVRSITEINIRSANEDKYKYNMYVITIKAKAFLWHQIRCMMGVLFLIGQRNERPEVIDELLNIKKCPRKPEYSMGSEFPLNLHHCEYDNLTWNYDTEVLNKVIDKLNTFCTFHAIKSEMLKGMVESLEEIKSKHAREQSICKCLSENLIPNVKTKIYVPLQSRPTCDSLEDKIKHFSKRKRIEILKKK